MHSLKLQSKSRHQPLQSRRNPQRLYPLRGACCVEIGSAVYSSLYPFIHAYNVDSRTSEAREAREAREAAIASDSAVCSHNAHARVGGASDEIGDGRTAREWEERIETDPADRAGVESVCGADDAGDEGSDRCFE